jgi:hypothetical protein
MAHIDVGWLNFIVGVNKMIAQDHAARRRAERDLYPPASPPDEPATDGESDTTDRQRAS